jgi:hypothetical protein
MYENTVQVVDKLFMLVKFNIHSANYLLKKDREHFLESLGSRGIHSVFHVCVNSVKFLLRMWSPYFDLCD